MISFRIAHTALEKSHEALITVVGQRLSSDNTSDDRAAAPLQINQVPDAYVGLTREDTSARFPRIAFWDQKDFKKSKENQNSNNDVARAGESKPARGSARMKEGENVMMDFVELEDGKIVDGLTAKLIRDELRAICHELHKKELLSRNWSSIGITARSFVFAHIYAKFPYLMLCHNDWKVHAIVGPIVSQWWVAEDKRIAKRTGVPLRSVRVKIEKDIGIKHSSPDVHAPSPKRQRTTDPALLSLPLSSPQNVDPHRRQPTIAIIPSVAARPTAPPSAVTPVAAILPSAEINHSSVTDAPDPLTSPPIPVIAAPIPKLAPRARQENPL